MVVVALTPKITVAGQALGATWLSALIEVRVEREFQVPGRCTLRFGDPGYALIEQGLIALGTPLVVEALAEDGSTTSLINGEVTSIAIDQREAEQPELVIVAHDKSHRLGRGTSIKSYLTMAYSDIVTQLASDCGLAATVDSTDVSYDYVMKVDSDLGLLSELADRVGYDWWVEDQTLYFQKPAAGTTVSLALGDPLRSFSVRASGQPTGSVTVNGWNRAEQQSITSNATTASGVLASSDMADLVTDGSYVQYDTLFGGLAVWDQAEADQLSQAIVNRTQAATVTARGVATANGAITLGGTVEVTGAGPLNGTYPVTKVEHVYRPSGFLTRFVSGDRRSTSLVDTLAGGRANRSSLFYRGVVIGQVTNINDPNNSGRVKVRFPGADQNEESGWARIVAVGGGTSRGNVFIPEVNDEVLVAFESGDLRQPVILGGLYSSKTTMPSTQIENGTVAVRGVTSRLGHTMLLLDGTEEATQAIELTLAGSQHTLHLGKDEMDIKVPQGLAINIVAGNSSIKFGTDGSITLAGPTIAIKADQQITLNAPKVGITADGEVQVQSNGQLSLQGAVVQLSGDGPVAIKGTPVAIN